MEASTLVPVPGLLRVERLECTASCIDVVAVTSSCEAACPVCGSASHSLHSRYVRTVADLPWQGVSVRIKLRCRRFFCINSQCGRSVFAERLPGVVAHYARRTERLQAALQLLGYALGGEAGARVAGSLGLSASPDTLLRRVRSASSENETESSCVRVLGVDDWAFRRGHTYGTLLVDLERRCIVDLLPDRTSQSLAEWLRTHPGVEVISRDRGGAYADGARQGAPDAQQVADRFHLLKNAAEALERCVARHPGALKEAAKEAVRACVIAANPETDAAESPHYLDRTEPESANRLTQRLTRPERDSLVRRERRLARYEEIVELRRRGVTQRAIAQHLQISRRTVRRFLRAGTFPERARTHRHNQLDAYEEQLRKLWDDGCHNASELYRRLKATGFTGCESSTRAYIRRWREQLPPELARSTGKPGGLSPPPRTPTPRSVAWLIIKGPTAKDPSRRNLQQSVLDLLLANSPEIARGREMTLSFFEIVRDQKPDHFATWLAEAKDAGLPEFRAFAKGLEADRDAVVEALTTAWSNGQVEGQVNRLKFIKRSMYGRAKFDLLKARVMPMVRSA